MANRNFGTAIPNSNPVSDFDLSGFGVSSEPGANFIRSLMVGAARVATYTYTVGTTKDNDGDTIAAADDVILQTGFSPRLVVVWNSTSEILYISAKSGSEVVLNVGGAIGASAAIEFGGDTCTLGNAIQTNANAYTVHVFG